MARGIARAKAVPTGPGRPGVPRRHAGESGRSGGRRSPTTRCDRARWFAPGSVGRAAHTPRRCQRRKSPQTEGGALEPPLVGQDGAIPVCAGPTEQVPPPGTARLSYPRAHMAHLVGAFERMVTAELFPVCGADLYVLMNGTGVGELSPRVRGLRVQVVQRCGDVGVIPACARPKVRMDALLTYARVGPGKHPSSRGSAG